MMGLMAGSLPSTDEDADEEMLQPPRSWRNWQKHLQGSKVFRGFELRLFSDADFVSEALGYGPYSFLNALAHSRSGSGSLKPGIVLRADWLLPADVRVRLRTNDDYYHGGSLPDELAALASLLLDARIMAGPIDREFGPDEDPLGRPRGYGAVHLPLLPVLQQPLQLPRLNGTRDLGDLADLATLPTLAADDAAVLIKAARLFQNALWISDATPEIAWLLLVSAIETAAGRWDSDQRTPEERFEFSFRGVVNILRKEGAERAVPKIARALSKLIGATSKFVSFMETFSPGAPEQRPPFDRFNFSRVELSASCKRIYELRSRALHSGVPFPYPMCLPPTQFSEGVFSEAPGGLAATAMGATWSADDTPMLLHTFAYLTRGALIAWWRTLMPTSNEVVPDNHQLFAGRSLREVQRNERALGRAGSGSGPAT